MVGKWERWAVTLCGDDNILYLDSILGYTHTNTHTHNSKLSNYTPVLYNLSLYTNFTKKKSRVIVIRVFGRSGSGREADTAIKGCRGSSW